MMQFGGMGVSCIGQKEKVLPRKEKGLSREGKMMMMMGKSQRGSGSEGMMILR